MSQPAGNESDDKTDSAKQAGSTKDAAPQKPAGGGAGGGAPQGPPPAKVRVDAVREEAVERWREVTGELRAVRRSTVASEQAGQVVEFNVDPGDPVEQGQILAVLDDQLARLEVERARATIRTREASITEQTVMLDKSKRDLQRIEDSYSRNGASQVELDDIRTGVASADAKLAQARSELAWAQSDLKLAEKRLTDMTVKAPFAGVIVAKRTEIGQWVSEGETVLELVALDALDAWLDVPEAFAARLLPSEAGSAEVVLRVPSLRAVGLEPEIRAKVSSVIPSADPLSRLFPVRVRLENKAGNGAAAGPLRPGMTVVGLVPTGEPKQALTISKDAVLRNESGSFVYFDSGGVSAIAPVRVEYAVGNRVVIQSPVLKPGMQVVVEGNERMFPGQPLAIQSASFPAAQPK
jgi:RND family efflux transporter MFP subunit